MKKYKLIKEYPGSPELGSIAYTSKNTLADAHYNYIIGEDGPFQCSWILKKHVDNNPEYWEEKIEKDYEILSFGYIGYSEEKSPYTVLNKQIKGDYHLGYLSFTEEMLLQRNQCFIHSVKRLSDGEIFTIGDICYPINTNYNKHPITKFWFDIPGQLRVDSENYSITIKTIIKAKKPLFTTDDGKEIFEDDNYWIVTDRFYNVDIVKSCTPYRVKKSGIHYFSTKEAAEEYVLLNKPCLSALDVINNIHAITFDYDSDSLIINDYPSIHKLVKQKLKKD
jgi:hypothetical protein